VRDVPKKGGVLVGFHERRSSYVADMRECAILPPRISALLPELRRLVESLSIRARLRSVEEGLVLDADFAFELSPRLAEVLANGVPLYFRVDFTLTRSRWYWWDETAAGSGTIVELILPRELD